MPTLKELDEILGRMGYTRKGEIIYDVQRRDCAFLNNGDPIITYESAWEDVTHELEQFLPNYPKLQKRRTK